MARRFVAFSLAVLAACSDDAMSLDPIPLDASNDGGWAGGSRWPSCSGGVPEGACTRAELAPSAADESALGFSAEAFLQLITGEHRAQVTWQSDADAAARSSELVVTVQPRGDVRLVRQALSTSAYGETFTFGNTGATYYTCGDHLAVDAELRVVMPDGSLDETLQGTLEAESGRHARVQIDVQSDSLAGSLRSAVEGAGGDQLSIALGIAELGTGLEGKLSASQSQPSGNVELGATCNTLGSFTLAQGCPLGAVPLVAAEEVLGLSFAGALERLNATSPAVLSDTGAALSLSFTAESSATCVSIDTPATLPSVLEFPGTVSLESSDGRVGGTLEVQLAAKALAGELSVVTAYADYLVPDASGLAEMAPRYAILEPLTWSPNEPGGFEFAMEAREEQFGGVLRALGHTLSCQGSQPCEEVCPGPGCIASPAVKWGVRWGELQLSTSPSPRAP